MFLSGNFRTRNLNLSWMKIRIPLMWRYQRPLLYVSLEREEWSGRNKNTLTRTHTHKMEEGGEKREGREGREERRERREREEG